MAREMAFGSRFRVARLALSPAQTIAIGYAAVILIGGTLLSLPIASETGRPTPFLTALFTASSAVCVTGLVVVDTADHYSTFGELLILALVQIGGFGYMTSWALLALILGWRIGLRERIILTQAHNLYQTGGVVRFTKRLALMALTIEAVGAVILTLRWWMDLPLGRAAYLGIFHSVSAFNNAGFDVMGGFHSLRAYVADPVVNVTFAVLIVLGGLGFSVLFDLLSRHLTTHSRTVLLGSAILLAGGAGLFFLLEFANPRTLGALPPGTRLLAAAFQGVVPRTAGFSTVDVGSVTQPALALLVVLMFIGASPGGTGGGIKTTTFIAPLAIILSTIRGTGDPTLFRRRLPVFVVYKAVTIALVSVAFVMTMTVLLTRVEGVDFLKAFFETTSAFGTVGLSTGITPHLSPAGRGLVMLTMFAGRVGLLTLAFGLTRRVRPSRIRYPEDRIYIG
jgi:trk system potassium uptake protein TrkH